ncbi:MAG: 50S ribosomal protein L15 [Bacteroidetes bacterium]|nr:50S ribosomal protein L15 [Bacteroidota bacterium]
MDLSSLKPAKGSIKSVKRIGRGQGSGRGGTSTRGHKGAQSRSGYKSKAGFEGGQMPLQRRLPKYGFTNNNRIEFKAINISALVELAEKIGITTITLELLVEHGLASSKARVKVLGNGTLTSKLDITAHAFSKSAVAMIESNGGSATKL